MEVALRFCCFEYAFNILNGSIDQSNDNDQTRVNFQFEFPNDDIMELASISNFLEMKSLRAFTSKIIANNLDLIPPTIPLDLIDEIFKHLDPIKLCKAEEILNKFDIQYDPTENWIQLCNEKHTEWEHFMDLRSWCKYYEYNDIPSRYGFTDHEKFKSLRLMKDLHYQLALYNESSFMPPTDNILDHMDIVGKHIPYIILNDTFIYDIWKYFTNLKTLEIRNSREWKDWRLTSDQNVIKYIDSFIFCNNEVNEDSIMNLVGVLNEMKHLKMLDLSSNGLNNDLIQLLFQSLNKSCLQDLTCISLSENELDSSSIRFIIDFINDHPNIKLLDISQNNLILTNIDWMLINTPIDHLILSDNLIGSHYIHELKNLTNSFCSSLRTLILDGVNFSDNECLKEFLDGLLSKDIEYLSLSQCFLYSDALPVLFQFIQAKKTLKYLDISHNPIKPSLYVDQFFYNVVHIPNSLEKLWINKTLLHLDSWKSIYRIFSSTGNRTSLNQISFDSERVNTNLGEGRLIKNKFEDLKIVVSSKKTIRL